MGRYETRAEKTRQSITSKYLKIRKAMVEIRILLGLGERAKLEDIIEAVKELVANQ